MTKIECEKTIHPASIDTTSSATDCIVYMERGDTPKLYAECPLSPQLIMLTPRDITFADLEGLTVQQAKTKLLEATQICSKSGTSECPITGKN